MPTIIIPDKICPHCGGNKWYMYYRKDRNLTDYTCHIKIINNQSNYSKNNRDKRKIIDNKYRLRNLERKNEISKRSAKRQIDNLTDNYIKLVISSRNILSKKDIPQELIEINRKSIQLKRQLKQNTCQKQQKPQ